MENGEFARFSRSLIPGRESGCTNLLRGGVSDKLTEITISLATSNSRVCGAGRALGALSY